MSPRWGRKRPLSCAEVGEQIQLFVDGRVGAPTVHRIETHLENCRRCGLEVDAYRQIKHALARAEPGGVTEALTRLREFGKRVATSDAD